MRVAALGRYAPAMSPLLCLLLSTAPGAAESATAPDAIEEVEEAVDFGEQEEEVSFDGDSPGDSSPTRRFELPDVEYRPWLVALPGVVIALVAWNVRWRR